MDIQEQIVGVSQPTNAEATPLTVSVSAEVAERISFATHQCAVPVIRDLVVCNPTPVQLEGLTLTLSAEPEILGAKTWTIDRLSPGAEVRIRDRDTPLKGGLLVSLNESMRATLRLQLHHDDRVIATSEHDVRALARNEWGGAQYMPELLAAFVMPNDPAVQRLLKSASQLLDQQGKTPSLEGYQRKSRGRVWELASAVWAAVTSRRLTYAEPPASFERVGQKVRTPSDIEEQGLATCLDTALLFAAALEQIGLNTVLAFTRGHVLAGVWLQPQTLSQLTTDDPMELRKAIASQELILFETTMAAGAAPLPFSKAIHEAQRQVAEDREQDFVYAIDIKQARTRQIHPLPAGEAGPTGSSASESDRDTSAFVPAIEGPPEDLPAFDFGLDTAPIPDTPQGRLDHWKRKLLDLSKRNRLLNLRSSKTAIPIFCPEPARLEDRLAGGKSVTVITPPAREKQDGSPDEQLMLLRRGDDFSEQFARDALEHNQIVAQTNERDLQGGLTDLFRKAKLDLEEGGANTLFLALGMLRWALPGDQRHYRAPLILLPVKLERASAVSKLKLSPHEDDPVFNLTLLEMLRQEFHVTIPGLSEELPRDADGIDVSRIWDIVRQSVREVPGFEVVPEVVLSTFSFAKYLMWKDLSDRTEALKQSPFVRHLIDTPREAYGNSAAFLDPSQVDQAISPTELFTPLNADSSQIVAVHASAQDGDFVLEGPPGTGKSETIGNIIAHNLALGRRVLFVSEKMAALDVVYRRLRDKGLGDFCLELHSNKTNKKEIIAQLGTAWDERLKQTPAEWEKKAEELKVARDRLNALVDALHTPGPTGLSPRQALGRVVRYKDLHRMHLGWGPDLRNDDHAKSTEGLEALLRLAHDVGRQFRELEPDDPDSFAEIEREDWSFHWQDRIVAEARTLRAAAETLQASQRAFVEKMGLAFDPRSRDAFNALADLTLHFDAARKHDLGFCLGADAPPAMDALEQALTELDSYRQARERLSQPYPDAAIRTAPVAEWESEWTRVTTRPWPINRLGQRGLRKKMGTHCGCAHKGIRPEADFPVLSALQKHAAMMDAAALTLPAQTPWKGLDTDTRKAQATIAAGRSLRTSMLRIAGFDLDLAEVRGVFRKRYVDAREMLEPGMPLPEAGRRFTDALARFAEAAEAFLASCRASTAEHSPQERADEGWEISTLVRVAESIEEQWIRLKPWCQWMELRRRAEANGLTALVVGLVDGTVDALQARETALTAYCGWLLPKLIDARDALRGFSASEHEETLERFRKLDQELADLTGSYIRARLSGQVPGRDEKDVHQGFALLRREINKRAKHLPVRRLVQDMGDALLTLTPCLLMSPLSVAQYLSTETPAFDLVVFDEASQITVWDAIGAIARGRRAVIVGDPKQMPPTSFFDKAATDDDDDDGAGGGDLESILDEALAASVKHWRLTGHYRSRHESLIAFSNHAYYNSQLVTYPASETRETAVSLRKVEGCYGKGKDRTNPVEAKAVVQEVLRRLRNPQNSGHSIGVVTLNAEQQRLILDLLDEARRSDEALEPFFSDAADEPVFVKNLETVQGDQRDVILLSIAYGPTEPGAKTMSMNFGPLNRQGGERRLNVAITRATTEVVIFASFDASMIDLSRTQSVAVRHLKQYLDFAARGPIALGEAIRSVAGTDSYDSDFEFVVAEGLRKRNWTIHTQIGVSKFRIDLGVVHPDTPGRYLAGVECDGATYHAMPCARDRDRVRHAILERLGWNLIRIWSTDFFLNPQRVLERVDAALKRLLDQDRAETARALADAEAKARADERSEQSANAEGGSIDTDTPAAEAKAPQSQAGGLPPVDAERTLVAAQPSPPHTTGFLDRDFLPSPAPPSRERQEDKQNRGLFANTDSPLAPALKAEIAPDRFYEPGYSRVVTRLAGAVIDAEGPITFKLLSERIARLHGFQRTGSEIKKVIWAAIHRGRRYTPGPDGQKIFWPKDVEPQPHLPFRGLKVNGQDRGWADVPYPEKLGLALDVMRRAKPDEDIPAACAARIGLGRLRAATRTELTDIAEAAKRLL